MNNQMKYLAAKAVTTVLTVFSACAVTPVVVSAQTSNTTAAQVAAAVLPLPESLRTGATVVVHEGTDKYTVLKKGSNEMVCIRQPTEGTGGHYKNGKIFWSECYNESIAAVLKREIELRQEFLRAGKTPDIKMLDDTINGEIKAGKLKLPDHPTLGFQMLGPLGGYDFATNSVSSEINAWQMVIIPYATGASLTLPEVKTEGMPWVMLAGTWIAHIMVTHVAPVQMDHGQ